LAHIQRDFEPNRPSIIRVTPILRHRVGRPDWGVVAIWIVLPATTKRVANHNPPVSARSLDDGDEEGASGLPDLVDDSLHRA